LIGLWTTALAAVFGAAFGAAFFFATAFCAFAIHFPVVIKMMVCSMPLGMRNVWHASPSRQAAERKKCGFFALSVRQG
jgi:hypothetical protein